MEHLKFIIVIFSLGFFVKFNAQIIEAPASHSTVAGIKVSYKSVPSNTSTEIMAAPQVTVNLKTTIGVNRVHFKIINKTTQTVIYQASYMINSGIVTHENGKKLFERNNNLIYLSTGQTLLLKLYTYQIQTEDTQANLSTIFSSIQ